MSNIITKTRILEFLPPQARPPVFWGNELTQRVDAEMKSQVQFRKAVEHLRGRIPPPFVLPQTRLGIEIEVENMNPEVMPERFKWTPWQMKGDGSLRNHGAEFISVPILPKDVPLALAVLYSWFQKVKAQPDFSWRTSTHVHVEANTLTIEQFRKFLLLYLVYEESLFEFSRPGRRETNIFCTPLSRTDLSVLRPLFQSKSWEEFVNQLKLVGRSIQKYSALNINHMFGFGTLEFRHLGGEPNPEKIAQWIGLLMGLYDSAVKMDWEYLTEQIRNLNTNSTYHSFSQLVFGPASTLLSNERPDLFLSRGVTLCKELLSQAKIPKPSAKIGMDAFVEAEEKRSKKDPLAGERPPPDYEEPEDAALPINYDMQPVGTHWADRRDLHAHQPATGFNPLGRDMWGWAIHEMNFRNLPMTNENLNVFVDEFVRLSMGLGIRY